MIYYTRTSKYEIASDGKQFRRAPIHDEMGIAWGPWASCTGVAGERGTPLFIDLPGGVQIVTSIVRSIAWPEAEATTRRMCPPPGVL